MNIKLFSLAKGEPALFANDKKLISDCANIFTSEQVKFSNFVSPKRMFLAVSQALRSADCIIIGVQSQLYNSIKKTLCSALEIETEQKEYIYSELVTLFEKGRISDAALINNSTFPVKANIFATNDMLCCGYAISSGSQSIVVLPLDSIRTSDVVFGSLYKYLSQEAQIEQAAELAKIRRFRATERLVSLLNKSKTSLAVANLNGVDLIRESVDFVSENNTAFRFGNDIETRSPMQPVKDYMALSAQNTRVETKSDYAIGVSSVFAESNNEDNMFIYIAVADKNETVVTKIFATDEENSDELICVGVQNAIQLAGNHIVEKMNALNSKSAKASKKLRQNLITAIAFAIGGSTALCAILALLLGN